MSSPGLRRSITVGVAVAALAASAASPVYGAETADGAVCETHDVVVKAATVQINLEPELSAEVLFTAAEGEFFTCSAVTMGGRHSQCGAVDSQVWVVLTDFERFDAYVPSSCVADVWF